MCPLLGNVSSRAAVAGRGCANPQMDRPHLRHAPARPQTQALDAERRCIELETRLVAQERTLRELEAAAVDWQVGGANGAVRR
jgi:hypothetical protein